MIEIINIEEPKKDENQEQFQVLDSIYQELNNRYKSGHVCDSYLEEVTTRFNNEYERIVTERREKGITPLYPKPLVRLTVEFSRSLYGSKRKIGWAI